MAAQKRSTIKQDLLDQLEVRGIVGAYYNDMIDDYMSLYDTKKNLIADIKTRGVTTAWGTNIKKNDSVAELNKTLAQMQKMLDWLGLRPPIGEAGPGDDEEM